MGDLPPNSTTRMVSDDAWRLVSIGRDIIIAGTCALMAWSLHELYSLSNRVTAIEVSRFSAADANELERRIVAQIADANIQRVNAYQALQGQLTSISGTLGEIKGGFDETRRRSGQ